MFDQFNTVVVPHSQMKNPWTKKSFEKLMKNFWNFVLCLFCLPGSAAIAASTGTATLSAEGRRYVGSYSMPEKLVSFDIDGLVYRGYYASNAEDNSGANSGISTGKWGRAFLFASSANVLRCQLETGFPKVSGRCQGADGRIFLLTSDNERKTSTLPKRQATK